MTEQAMTSRQVAELLGVPVRTVEYWRYKGTGPAYFRAGREVRYWPADVRRFARPQRRTA